MSRLLCIDTALVTASICLSKDGELIDKRQNSEMKEQGAWLQPAVNDLLAKNNSGLDQLDAIAVSIGPGSYTGLRVGLAAAKGYCYALKIPLISVGTLEIMAHSVRKEARELICPMIDARRMEVYMAMYNKDVKEIISPLAMILHTDYFESILSVNKVLFCGSGADKFKPMVNDANASFTSVKDMSASLSTLAEKYLIEKKISDIAYCEPQYLKDFYSSTNQATN
jgi:tRNA threonylcarbamoyladenosine biosynthesis protein TsaB